MVESLPIYDVMNMVSNKVFSLSQVDSGFPNVSLKKLGSTFITKVRDVLVRPKACQSTHRSIQILYHKSRHTQGRRSP